MEYPQTLYHPHPRQSFSNPEPGLIRRLLARVIDYQLIFILLLFCDFLVEGLITTNLHWFSKQVYEIPTQPMTLILLILLFVGYFILFHTLDGQTPGKFICGIRVAAKENRSPNAKPVCPNLARNILREAGWLFSLMLGGWLLLMVFLNRNRRGLHDWLGCSVVRGA